MDHNVLVAFDFDHTICDDNTDLVVQELLGVAGRAISKDVEKLRRTSWIAYMGRIFELLQEVAVGPGQIEETVVGIPAVAGMQELLVLLQASGHEIVVISDSNSVFIDTWLRSRGLERVVSRVFTNPARYDDHGRLRVDGYHAQTACRLSPVNLCKGQILTDYVRDKREQGRTYARIVYVGDGSNDLCPILRLSKTDLACPRKGYRLIERLDGSPSSTSIQAKIVPWADGIELQRSLKELIYFR
ncbi:PREDICTED: pyridoxal phosphate phosphatase PHOSPHO2-like [Wasmannia auropunctata]|uniref:pyridoxal phosphate phosphatase PHOSPHO2-like n=1 Tax=Wasmannia auropunctata TaxID=64793 RepID=UPI0005EE308D|nr:PREDICTED: pyridoxal phosphate phosphatase PHOSPHO2-like [Wasmannia auropunctata]XP_011685989.1 PREDICTED: pyridoxal phosphate phosphatase PHOSPHO2-like [Wasmannia auropunctata]XP_011685990.1 PREDICTED: pyridoxal phosphate phosphatase PHOSPHO2-like [Wasmannia auropunctata]